MITSKINQKISDIEKYFLIAWFVGIFFFSMLIFGIYRVKQSEIHAKEATESKSLFLANMSHEIRTPMNAIIGFAEILKKTSLDEQQQQSLSYIRSSSSNLLNIINDILDFSKIESGKLELEHISFYMEENCDNLYGILDVLAKNKNIDFSFDYNCKYHGAVLGDSTRLGQIIINIVNNAIKFTQEGGVKISVNSISEDDEEIRYEIRVKDTGIGISKDNMSKLFMSFTQADTSTNRKFGGTGLGLCISKTLAEMMDGGIDVYSELGVGSEFVINIKMDKDLNSSEHQKSCEVFLDKDLSGLRVLVAEDNKTNQILIDIILVEYGIDATIVNDGQEAVDILKIKRFDLVLMDIQMANLDGYEATKIIRDKNLGVLNNEICIVALSANAMKGDIEKLLESGMNGHLAKPIEASKLHEVLQKNLIRKIKNG